MPTFYLGFQVLEIEADGVEKPTDEISRSIQEVSSVGRVDLDDHDGVSATLRELTWKCRGLLEIAALKAFLDTCDGRAIPFWLQAQARDLTLNADHAAASTGIVIKTMGYTADLFADTGARRHLCFRKVSDGTSFYRKVTGAVNNGNGTETLSLDATLGQNITIAGWIVTFLRYCRLEEDVTPITFLGAGYATARLRVHELPREAPT